MRLIDAEPLSKKIRYECGLDCWGRVSETDVLTKIDIAPTIDAAPVVHAKWMLDSSFYSANIYHCTACNQKQMQTSKFCPECGAKMDGEDDEAD